MSLNEDFRAENTEVTVARDRKVLGLNLHQLW